MKDLMSAIKEYRETVKEEGYLNDFFALQSALKVIEILRQNRISIFGIDCYTIIDGKIRCLHDERALGLYYDWSCDGGADCWDDAERAILKIMSYPEIQKIDVLIDLTYYRVSTISEA